MNDQQKIEFTDEDVVATLTALNDFIVTSQMFASKRKFWDSLPDSEQLKYQELTTHAVAVKDKFLLLYAKVKREFN